MSNCILQALKTKILHPTYGIFYVKPFEKDGLPHFCWWNPKAGSYQHYTYKGGKMKWWKLLWFKGYIDGFPYEKLKIKLIRVL